MPTPAPPPSPTIDPPPGPPVTGTQVVVRVSVLDALSQLMVLFQAPVTPTSMAYLLSPRSYALTGGSRLFPRVTGVLVNPGGTPPGQTDRLVQLTLDGPGDFSVYTLTVSGPDLDPLHASSRLRFRLACDDSFDCRPRPTPVPAGPDLAVVIDYLAKDYSSFRQALLDFIPTRLPAWTERNEADIGMTLLELFAATADHLSYLQDRVANEAFLDTATQRRSVAGHLALIGYEMGENSSACVWLQFRVNAIHTLTAGSRFGVTTRSVRPDEPVVGFETLGAAVLRPTLGEDITVLPSRADCVLPSGSLSATLAGSFPDLQVGDPLLFDDGKGNRDVVRLASRPEAVAGASGPSTVVRWSQATPLSRDFCTGPVVARGNLVLAVQGLAVTGEVLRAGGGATGSADGPPARQRFRLALAPLAYLDADTLATFRAGAPGPDADLSVLPTRHESTVTILVGDDPAPWREQNSLLDSGPDDRVFRVEVDDRGGGTVVFGDGRFGRDPGTTSRVVADYRVGGGAAGNVAADTLGVFDPVAWKALPWLVAVTNPLPAVGGRDQESSDHARRFGPDGFRSPLVAVTAEDYQAAAQDFTDAFGRTPVHRASAALRWTGSWLMAKLSVDHRDADVSDAELRGPLIDFLGTRRLAGYDIDVAPPTYVPISLSINLCVKPGFLPGDVKQDALLALGTAALPGGRKGFFHPDNFSFGDRLDLGTLYALLLSLPGVGSAEVVRLSRLRSPRPDLETAANLRRGFLAVGPGDILRLDNDRNFPENGTLSLTVKGVSP